MAEIKAVAFDGYGTVFNFTEPNFIATMAEICDQQGLEADAADLWRRFLKAALYFRAEHHPEPVYRRYDEAWAIQLERVFKALKLNGDAWAAANHIKARLSDAPAYDEVYAVFDALRPHFRLALLSNADDDFLNACLDRNSLEFETAITSEQAGAIKPDAEVFLYLARRLGLAPQEVLYVGDNPVPDVLGPSRASMKSAWVNRHGLRKPRNVPYPDIRVKTLSELVPLLVPRLD